MLNKPLSIALALVATSFLACSSSSNNQDAQASMDASTEDSGSVADTGSTQMDSGNTVPDSGTTMMDSGMVADSGMTTSCDPVLQTGCPAMQSCYLSQTGGSCTMTPAMPVPDGQACGMGLCKPGSGCIGINGGMSTCYKLCRTAMMNADCTTTGTTTESCVGLRGIAFGACVANCDPFNDPCPATQTCSPIGNGGAICLGGQSAAGASCINTGSCVRGYVCVATSMTMATCDQICDATHACPMMKTCTMFQGYNFGGCM
jgi:hypothetical protein